YLLDIANSDVVIDKGVQVYVPIIGIQHDPKHYPEPEKFDPERFIKQSVICTLGYLLVKVHVLVLVCDLD
ncbi:hypothetical protein ILUMI_17125, partial [Ignelater luminosus]